MKSKLRYIFSVILLLVSVAVFSNGSAEAANQVKEFYQENYTDDNGRQWLRLEFCMKDEKIDISEVADASTYSFKKAFILKDTKLGNLDAYYGFDRTIAKSLTATAGKISSSGSIQKGTEKDLYLTVFLAKQSSEQEVKYYILPRDKKSKDKKAKKYTRLIIEIAADVAVETDDEDLGFVSGVKGHTLVVDPGHGGSDSGAVGVRNLRECDVTFDVSMKMKKILENSGAKVIMTRTTDVDVYGRNASASQELQARCDYVTPKTDIFVCVHANAASNPDGKGTETYYCAGSNRGRQLANAIQDNIIDLGKTVDRGIKTANFYVLKHTSVPAVLIELGFVTNPHDAALLGDKDFCTKLAYAICKGIARYYGGK